MPIGTLGSRPIAWVEPSGSILDADGRTTLRWWVLAEDRLHVTEQETAVRQRLVEHGPVVETAVRVPGGDVVATIFGAVAAGGTGDPIVGLEIRNATAVPVAIAVVVGPVVVDQVGEHGLVGADGRAVTWSRRPSDQFIGASAEELADRLRAEAVATTGPVQGSGHVLTLLPLPHSQTLRVGWGRAHQLDALPAPEQVVAGWQNQMERGAALVPVDEAARVVWERDRRRVLLDDSPFTSVGLAARVGATLRLGWFDEASAATELLLERRGRGGRFVGDDVVATIAALDALSGWSRAGAPPESYDDLAVAVAAAATWLGSPRRVRRLDAGQGRRACLAVGRAASFLEWTGHGDAAVALRDRAPSIPTLDEDAAEGAVAELEPVDDAATRITRLLDGIAIDDDAGVIVLAGWSRGMRGLPIELHGLPTRWGQFSMALRWHGRRPALLWELEPWPDHPTTAIPELSAPGIDAAWRGSGWTGEDLLAEPEGVPVELTLGRPDEGSFS